MDLFHIFHGHTLYDPRIYQLFNIIFTSLPIIWFEIYDKEKSYDELENNIEYYKRGMKGYSIIRDFGNGFVMQCLRIYCYVISLCTKIILIILKE